MVYSQLRPNIKTADVIIFEGRGFGQRIIRALTGESASHIELVVEVADGLWAYGYRGKGGFNAEPLSQVIDRALAEGQRVYHGEAPAWVASRAPEIIAAAIQYRDHDSPPKYSFWSLPKVWIAQFTGKVVKTGLVCCTFVMRMWEVSGYTFAKTPDPGDFLTLCKRVTPITQN